MQFEKLIKNRFEGINILCNQYFNNGDTKAQRLSIFNNIEKELNKIITPQYIENIIDTINKCLDNIVDRLTEQCPTLKPDDIKFLALIIAGLSPRAVCMFTHITIKNFYTKRSRLITRIANSNAKDKDIFISKITQNT